MEDRNSPTLTRRKRLGAVAALAWERHFCHGGKRCLPQSENDTPAPFECDGLCAAAFDNQQACLTGR